MLGREVHQPITLKFGFPGNPCEPVSAAGYVCDLWDRMVKIQHLVRSHLKEAAQHQKRDHDTRLAHTCYKVGDLVYCLDSTRKIGRSPKLRSNPWKGPFVVTKKLSDLLYQLSGQYESKNRIMHHDRIKPYCSDIVPDWVPAVQKRARSIAVVSTPKDTGNTRKEVLRNKNCQKPAGGESGNISVPTNWRSTRKRRQPDWLKFI